jgi:hypothetical protein
VVGKDSERTPLAFRSATNDFQPIAPIVEGSASLFERIDRSRGILCDGNYSGYSDGIRDGAARSCVNEEPHKLCDRLCEIRIGPCLQAKLRFALDVNRASVGETQHDIVESVAIFELQLNGTRADQRAEARAYGHVGDHVSSKPGSDGRLE